MTMPRTDHDSWDITESVGATALGVAAARAAETESEDPLIEDRFARLFLEAAGEGTWTWFGGSVPSELAAADPKLLARMRVMVDFMATRTAFFDEFFLNAAKAGQRQVVILAAGLDARAWRLPWPDGTVVYELDQPQVLQFKAATLQDHEPTCRRVGVPIDLRQNWPTVLRDAGFDPSEPTAWSAEGLLRYLPSQAQDLLFERIHALSVAGSRLVANAPSRDALNPERLAREREQMQRIRTAAARALNTQISDVEDLVYNEERTDVVEWLSEHGWDASVDTAAEQMARFGRGVASGADIDSPPTFYVSAQRG
jgi:methyltransferase (TIGR00027 family)